MRVTANLTVDKNTFGRITQGLKKGLNRIVGEISSVRGAIEKSREIRETRRFDYFDIGRMFGAGYIGYRFGGLVSEFGERSGIIMSDLENATESVLANYQKLNIFIGRFFGNFENMVRRVSVITGSVNEALEAMVLSVERLGTGAEDFLSSNLAKFALRAGINIGEMAEVVASLSLRLGDTGKAIEYASKNLGILVQMTGSATKGFELLKGAVTGVGSLLEFLTEEETELFYKVVGHIQRTMPGVAMQLGENLHKYVLAMTIGRDTFEKITQNLVSLPQNVRELFVEMMGFSEFVKSGVGKVGDKFVAYGELSGNIIKNLVSAVDTMRNTVVEAGKGIENQISNLSKENNKLGETAKGTNKQIKTQQDTISKTNKLLDETTESAMKARTGLEEFAKLRTQLELAEELAKVHLDVANAIQKTSERYLELLRANVWLKDLVTTLVTIKGKIIAMFSSLGIGLEHLIMLWFGGKFLGAIIRGVGRAYSVFGGVLIKVLSKVGGVAAGAFRSAFLKGLIRKFWLGAAIYGLIKGILDREKIGGIVGNVVEGVTMGLINKELVDKALNKLGEVLSVEKVMEIAKNVMFAPIRFAEAGFEFIKELVQGKSFKEALSKMIDTLTFSLFGRERVMKVIEWVRDVMRGIVEEINSMFERFAVKMSGFIVNILKSVNVGGIFSSFIENVEKNMIERATSLIAEELKDVKIEYNENELKRSIMEVIKSGVVPTSVEELSKALKNLKMQTPDFIENYYNKLKQESEIKKRVGGMDKSSSVISKFSGSDLVGASEGLLREQTVVLDSDKLVKEVSEVKKVLSDISGFLKQGSADLNKVKSIGAGEGIKEVLVSGFAGLKEILNDIRTILKDDFDKFKSVFVKEFEEKTIAIIRDFLTGDVFGMRKTVWLGGEMKLDTDKFRSGVLMDRFLESEFEKKKVFGNVISTVLEDRFRNVEALSGIGFSEVLKNLEFGMDMFRRNIETDRGWWLGLNRKIDLMLQRELEVGSGVDEAIKGELELVVDNLVALNRKMDELNQSVQMFAQRGMIVIRNFSV